jgi:hypothetical protein
MYGAVRDEESAQLRVRGKKGGGPRIKVTVERDESDESEERGGARKPAGKGYKRRVIQESSDSEYDEE